MSWPRGFCIPNTLSLCTVMLIFATPTSLATFDPNVICSLLVSGTKIKDPRACNAWIECIDGKPVSGTCTDDDFYDRTKMACVPQQSTTCISSNPCAVASGETVVVPDPYSCGGYYVCRNGIGTKGQCPNGMNYNPGTQNCILNFPCVAKMDPDSYCNILPDGVFIKNTANCNGYEMCWNGEVVNGTCPGTFYYNPVTGYCDYPQSVDCVDIVTNPPDAPDPEDVCTKSGTFISDKHTCNGYYLCLLSDSGNMELVHANCPSGRFFNPSNGGSCIARTQTTCAYDRCAGLGQLTIQLSDLSGDGCHGFALCQDGVSIGTGNCPTGEYFDEITQRCTTQLIDYPSCASGTGTDSLHSTETSPSNSSSSSSSMDLGSSTETPNTFNMETTTASD